MGFISTYRLYTPIVIITMNNILLVMRHICYTDDQFSEDGLDLHSIACMINDMIYRLNLCKDYLIVTIMFICHFTSNFAGSMSWQTSLLLLGSDFLYIHIINVKWLLCKIDLSRNWTLHLCVLPVNEYVLSVICFTLCKYFTSPTRLVVYAWESMEW